MLTFNDLSTANLSRGNRWHKNGLQDWTTSDWAIAMAGESGEVCNTVKKLNRLRSEMKNINSHDQVSSEEEAISRIGEEIADTIIYSDLLAQSLGLNLADEIVKKFNFISERYGFPEKLQKIV